MYPHFLVDVIFTVLENTRYTDQQYEASRKYTTAGYEPICFHAIFPACSIKPYVFFSILYFYSCIKMKIYSCTNIMMYVLVRVLPVCWIVLHHIFRTTVGFVWEKIRETDSTVVRTTCLVPVRQLLEGFWIKQKLGDSQAPGHDTKESPMPKYCCPC